MNKKPDFSIPLNIPGNFVEPKEVEQIYPHLEANLKRLVEINYLTNMEAVAYAKFITDFGSLTGFMMDEFLKFYRSAIANREPQS